MFRSFHYFILVIQSHVFRLASFPVDICSPTLSKFMVIPEEEVKKVFHAQSFSLNINKTAGYHRHIMRLPILVKILF